jgi:hypothetical protein
MDVREAFIGMVISFSIIAVFHLYNPFFSCRQEHKAERGYEIVPLS